VNEATKQRAVAALLDLVAARVEDAITEIDARLALLSTTRIWSAPMPKRRSRACALLRREIDRRARAVEHDEVVARACILVKRNRMGNYLSPYNEGSPGGRS